MSYLFLISIYTRFKSINAYHKRIDLLIKRIEFINNKYVYQKTSSNNKGYITPYIPKLRDSKVK